MAALGDAGRGDSVADATHDLYRQYGKQIYAYCLHQLRSREEAEDAVQTTFLNAFRGLQRGTTTRFEQAWLYKIAQNVCIARRSSSGRRLRLEAPDDFEILQEVVPSGNGSGDTLELMGLDGALEKMPENQRRAILLREWQGLSYREIATELSLSQGAVEMLIFRARRTLATALEQPEPVQRRRAGRAKTGFSFGSLVAALKGLFSTGAALKMATVAMTATVAGTNAVVHSVVHPSTRVQARGLTMRSLVAPSAISAHLATPIHASAQVASHAVQARARVDRAFIGDVATTHGSPTIVQDEAPPAPVPAPAQTEQAAPAPALQSAPSETGSSSSSDSSSNGHQAAKGSSPPNSSGSGGSRSSAGDSGPPTDRVRGTSAMHDGAHGPFSPPDTTTTTTTTTITTGSTDTTETTTTSTDESTTTTATTTTTTTTDSGGGHGHGHDNADGNVGGGNGGGNGHQGH